MPSARLPLTEPDCAFFGDHAVLHHVGLAVDSIRAVRPDAEPVANEREGVRMAFLRLNGVRIELLEPLDESSPIAGNLRTGAKLLHLCYEVPNLDEAIRVSRAAGFHRLKQVAPSPAFGNRRVAWVYSKQYGLIELLEA